MNRSVWLTVGLVLTSATGGFRDTVLARPAPADRAGASRSENVRPPLAPGSLRVASIADAGGDYPAGGSGIVRESHGRQGGEDCASATTIPSLPYTDTGTTVGYADDYDVWGVAGCPTESTSPDVVYAYTPAATETVTITTVCGGGGDYDTKVFVYEGDCTAPAIACDDDTCGGPEWHSIIEGLELTGGTTYYIVVDGWGGESGTYELKVIGTGPCCDTTLDCHDSTLYHECLDLGEIFHDEAADCGEVTCVMPQDQGMCGDDHIFGPGYDDSSHWAHVSDERTVFTVYEGFWNLSTPIAGFSWWGVEGFWNGETWNACTKSADDFVITFYSDDGDAPGAPVASPFSVAATREAAGSWGMYDLLRWTVELPDPVIMAEGWVSIVGVDIGEDCWFLWRDNVSAGSGDNHVYQWDGETLWVKTGDASLCLHSVACCLTDWTCVDTTTAGCDTLGGCSLGPDSSCAQDGARCEQDCNANGVPDGCDIVAGTSPDCNGNGVPDECDITAGTSDDENGNGIPDECDPTLQVSLGVRETNQVGNIGDFVSNASGPIEWFDKDNQTLFLDGVWRLFSFDLGTVPITAYTGDGLISTDRGVLEHIRFKSNGYDEPITVWIDDVRDVYDPAGPAPEEDKLISSFDEDEATGEPFVGGTKVMFQYPSFSGSTSGNIASGSTSGIDNFVGHGDTHSVKVEWAFVDDDPSRWLRLTTYSTGQPQANPLLAEPFSDYTSSVVSFWMRWGEPDCNENGVPDSQDISGGTSQDCNLNSVPDECDIDGGTSEDSNANGTPDECETIATARAAGVGAEVAIASAVVSSTTDLIASSASKNFHIQDATGGITVYGNNTNVDSLLVLAGEGDRVTITAFTDSYGGLYELDLNDGLFNLISYGFVGVPTPTPVTVADFQDGSPTAEGFESMVVTLPDVTFDEQGTFQGLTEYTVRDGALTATVRISTNEQDLMGESIPCGRVNITGIFSQFDTENPPPGTPGTGYLLLPRTIADIVYVDCNANGTPDDQDIAGGTSEDCNGNCVPDECDIAEGTSADCNANGIPDECDIAGGTSNDCNNNDIPDECDIGAGTSQDCNNNSIPDECDIGEGTSQDCNNNSIPDECDLVAGTSEDCQPNGIPDECDITGGTSPDCNANGTPDECEPDCNDNSIPDACDITAGTSNDCNDNGTPDECEIDINSTAPNGPFFCITNCDPDCNSNGTPDECDIADCPPDTPSCNDCNNNGTPDVCDIASGYSIDLDTNGAPDDCAESLNMDGVWSNPNLWNIGVVPDNTTSNAFSVTVRGEQRAQVVVVLDMNAEIDSLRVLTGATLDMSGGNLTIATTNGILNAGDLVVRDGFALAAGAPLALAGTRPLRLDGSSASVSSVSSTDTITSTATIVGQGVIDANFANEGAVLADVPAATLRVEGPNPKVNDGLFEATSNGVLEVNGADVTGTGAYRADGGTIRVTNAGGPTTVAGASLEVVNSSGLVEVDGDVTVTLTGPVAVGTNGTYEGIGATSASLTADAVSITGNGINHGGRMLLTSAMSVTASGAVTVDGGTEPGSRGCTPPVLSVIDTSSANGNSMTVVGGGLLEAGGNATVGMSGALTLDTGGTVQGLAGSAATLNADSVLITNTNSNGLGGQMILSDTMTIHLPEGRADGSGGFTVGGAACACTPSRGCTPPVLNITGSAGFNGTLMEVSHGGQVVMGANATGELTGSLTIDTGGGLEGLAGSAASLTAGSVLITNTDSNGVGGQMVLTDTMSVGASGTREEATGALIVDGESLCDGSRGCTPPVLNVTGSAGFNAVSMGVLGGGQVQMGDNATGDVGGLLTVDTGGVLQGPAGSAATLNADSVLITNTDSNGLGGQLILTDTMSINLPETRAEGSGTVTVGGPTSACGSSAGCTPPILNLTGSAAFTGMSMEVSDGGQVEMGDNATGSLTGLLTVDTGGILQGPADSGASLSADSVLITNTGSNGVGGQIFLTGTMHLDVPPPAGAKTTGVLIVDGASASSGGCTPPILTVTSSAAFSGTSMQVLRGGQVEMGGDATGVVTGALTINGGGILRATAGSANSLTAGSVLITNTDTNGLGGEMRLNGTMTVTVEGDVTLEHCGCTRGVRGCTPPVLGNYGAAVLDINGGSLVLGGAGNVVVQSSVPVTLDGDFVNQSTDPSSFDWDNGQLGLDGSTLQTFEVAGTDVGAEISGPVNNFAMGELEVAAGAYVRFVDAFDNDLLPQTSCGEALYVHTLVLRNGATIELDDCRIYCLHLNDQGAAITTTGCGSLVVIPTGDFNGDGVVNLSDFAAFEQCLGGPEITFSDPACGAADFDEDGNIDLADFARFQEVFTG